jgi:hypothetical protein
MSGQKAYGGGIAARRRAHRLSRSLPPQRKGWRGRGARGSIAIEIAIVLAALLGFASLGTEVGVLLWISRQMQSAADSAAYGAAIARMRRYPADFGAEATTLAAAAGFVNGANGVAVTVNDPPRTGAYAGNPNALEVIIREPQSLVLASLFTSGAWSLSARSVALVDWNAVACVLALDPSATAAVLLKNNAIVTTRDCAVASNSNAAGALSLDENAAIDGAVNVVGTWTLLNNAAINGNPALEDAAAIEDPYQGLALPSPLPPCTDQNASAGEGGALNLYPGNFCNGWKIGNHGTINLAAGTYYLAGGLKLGNQVTIDGSAGVTIVITDGSAIAIRNNTRFVITAPGPSSGEPFQGIAVMGLSANANVTQDFANDSSLDIKGAIYFPHQTIDFDNNAETVPGGCTQIIGRVVRLANNVAIEANCTGVGTQPLLYATAVELVE